MRAYLIWGSNDEKSFTHLGEVYANTHQQAQAQARELDNSWLHYGSCTARGWRSATPDVKTVVTWRPSSLHADQLTVDDVLERAEEAIAERRKEQKDRE